MEVINSLRLVVKITGIDEPAYAQIGLDLNPPRVWSPSDKVFNICDSVLYHIEFSADKFKYYELRCKFRYLEFTDSPTPQQKSIDFTIKKDISIIHSGKIYQQIRPEVFFKNLAASFPVDTLSVDYRKATSLDLELCIGSPSFKQYVDLYYSTNDFNDAQWNCFRGGIGLFAILDKSTLPNLSMDPRTKDSLANGQLTKQLKFSKW